MFRGVTFPKRTVAVNSHNTLVQPTNQSRAHCTFRKEGLQRD